MKLYPSKTQGLSKAILAYLADGVWRTLDQVTTAVGSCIPAAPAQRAYVRVRRHKRVRRGGQPDRPMTRSADQCIWLGRRQYIAQAVWYLKKVGTVESRGSRGCYAVRAVAADPQSPVPAPRLNSLLVSALRTLLADGNWWTAAQLTDAVVHHIPPERAEAAYAHQTTMPSRRARTPLAPRAHDRAQRVQWGCRLLVRNALQSMLKDGNLVTQGPTRPRQYRWAYDIATTATEGPRGKDAHRSRSGGRKVAKQGGTVDGEASPARRLH
jgi:hypothetical protein